MPIKSGSVTSYSMEQYWLNLRSNMKTNHMRQIQLGSRAKSIEWVDASTFVWARSNSDDVLDLTEEFRHLFRDSSCSFDQTSHKLWFILFQRYSYQSDVLLFIYKFVLMTCSWLHGTIGLVQLVWANHYAMTPSPPSQMMLTLGLRHCCSPDFTKSTHDECSEF